MFSSGKFVARVMVLAGFLLMPMTLHAEIVGYDRELVAKKPSTNDDIGIAFMKTTGNFPDFSKVVEESNTYKKLNPLAQPEYKENMTRQLQASFASYAPKKSDLIIRVAVKVLFQKLANGESVLKLRTFPNDPVYFPFYFDKYPIALIIKDMDKFKEIHLSKEETDIVYSRLSLGGDATLLLQLYAIDASDTKPMLLDNVAQYPLLAEIGYIGFLNRRAEQIWAWKNTKYGRKNFVDGDGRDIIDLYPEGKK